MDNPRTIQELSDFIGRIVNAPLFPKPRPKPTVIVGIDQDGRKVRVTIEELQ